MELDNKLKCMRKSFPITMSEYSDDVIMEEVTDEDGNPTPPTFKS